MNRNIGRCCVYVAVLSVFMVGNLHSSAVAAELMGSQKIIERIEKKLSAPLESPKSDASQLLREQLKSDIQQFTLSARSMKAEAAAEGWIKLLDRYWSLPRLQERTPPAEDLWLARQGQTSDNLNFHRLMEAMPGPDAWEHLSKQFEKRTAANGDEQVRNLGLRLLGYFLNNEPEKELQAIADFEKNGAVTSEEYQRAAILNQLAGMRRAIQEGTGVNDGSQLVALFEDSLKMLQGPNTGGRNLMIPDLVDLAGEPKAEELIAKAIRIPGVYVMVPGGGKTLQLARRVLLKELENVQLPQWRLLYSIDCVPLYEAMRKKFPPVKISVSAGNDFFSNEGYNAYEGDEREARSYYILGLIAQDRLQDALAFVKGLEAAEVASMKFDSMLKDVSGKDLSLPLYQFYEEMLKSVKPFPLWEEYVTLSIAVGKTEEALKALDQYASGTTLGAKERMTIDSIRIKAYLATDEVDKAVSIITDDMKIDVSKESESARSEIVNSKFDQATLLLTLGRLLNNSAWIELAVTTIKDYLHSAKDQGLGLSTAGHFGCKPLIDYFLENKKFEEAESITMESVLNKMESLRKMPDGRGEMETPIMIEEDLVHLLQIYEKAGRPEDVIYLLEHAPWFRTADIKDLDSRDVTYITASALHSLNRNPEAVAILKYYLYEYAGDDRAYQLLIDSSSEDLIPWLDQLYERDRFEERPLIWKAVLLMKNQKLDEAEKTVRAALKVDPTDGEQPAGDRVRGYAVLADILDARGDKENAAVFHKVVEAVRLAEKGDEYTEAGLIKRSIAQYEQAEALFADAYCVQWRLAERLYAMGKFDEAAKHYRMVFERMPEQFGRVANFCFGCEGVFNRENSRGIAETVLTHSEQAGAPKPQVYFLLGQLRETQERYKEAYDYYKKALALDPDYLDVWAKLYGMHERLFLPQKEREEISFKILGLDPLMKHHRADLTWIFDIKRLWPVLEANKKFSIATPDHLFVLSASQTRLEERAKKDPYNLNPYDVHTSHNLEIRSPYDYLMESNLFQAIMALINVNARAMAYMGVE